METGRLVKAVAALHRLLRLLCACAMVTVLAQVARGKKASRECRVGTSPPGTTTLCLSNAAHNANVRPSYEHVGNASTSTYGQARTTDKTHHLTTLVAAVVPKAGKARKQIGTTVGTTVDGNLRYEFKQIVLDALLLSRPLLQRVKHYPGYHE